MRGELDPSKIYCCFQIGNPTNTEKLSQFHLTGNFDLVKINIDD